MGRLRQGLGLVLLALWASCAQAAPVPAHAGGASPPLLPMEADDAATRAWADRYIEPKGYVRLAVRDGQAFFYSPKDVSRSKDGRPVAWIRYELGRPMIVDKLSVRSMRHQLELDCRKHRYFEHQIDAYDAVNLTGAPLDDGGPALHWFEVIAGSADAAWFTPICAALAPASLSKYPPLPAPVSRAALKVWAEANLNTNGFVTTGYTPIGAFMYGIRGLTIQPDGHVQATIRLETVPQAGHGGFLSQVLRVEIDCQGRRSRTLAAWGYSKNDVEGAETVVSSRPDPWDKLQPDGAGTEAANQICAQRGLLKDDIQRTAAMPTPLQTVTSASADDWVDQNIYFKGYTPAGYNNLTAGFYRLAKPRQAGQDLIQVSIRYEMFWPIWANDGGLIRSSKELAEFDCAHRRLRYLGEERHPGANLLGPATTVSTPSAWGPVDSGSLLESVLKHACSA